MEWTGHIDVIGFGTAFIAAFSLLLRYVLKNCARSTDRYHNLIENHLAHNTEALNGLKAALEVRSSALGELRDVLKDVKSELSRR